mmetsp:Transcript_36391/g.107963  ORF Transcript_36391/g.107963 Transcript_36391/m.107963 type:complete len:468 (+) Transcript_36391:69-1472(+)
MIALVAGLSHSLLVGGPPTRTGGARCASSPCMAESPRKLRVGLVGGGTVGGGIVTILEGARELQASLGVDVEIATICVRDKAKPRDFPLPAGCAVVDDVEEILGDGSIDLVCEVMGGTTLAKEVVMRSIADGKHVVTANKALIAAALPELQEKLAEANAKQVLGSEGKFGFEAAVCGGIPIIHALQRDFLGDEVSQLSGIINGCTNFILSNMAQGGLSYSDALKEASALGYAEADPTLDVGGFDARSKLKILIKLAFGTDVGEDEIPCRGITEVTATDFEYAALQGGTVKLLGVAKRDGDRLSAFVSPCFVPTSNTLASISGATNAVQIGSANLGSTVLVGQGAGRLPTANSCVSDILDIAQGTSAAPFPKQPLTPALKFGNSYTSSFYVRIRFREQLGIIQSVGEIFSDAGVSIYNLLQTPIKNPNDSMFVITTDPVDVAKIKRACVALEATDWCLGDTFYMPVVE